MKRIAAYVLTAGLALSGTVANAVEHTVYINNYYYFPLTVYFQTGDTIRFENRGSKYAAIQTSDGSWVTGAIDRDNSQTITIAAMSSSGTITLKAPYFYTEGRRGRDGKWEQYDNSIGMSVERSFAPNSCPDGRLGNNVCP